MHLWKSLNARLDQKLFSDITDSSHTRIDLGLRVTNGDYSAAEWCNCLEPKNYGIKSRSRVLLVKGEPKQRTDQET